MLPRGVGVILGDMEGGLTRIVRSIEQNANARSADSEVMCSDVGVRLDVPDEAFESLRMWLVGEDRAAGPTVCRPDGEGSMIRTEVDDPGARGESDTEVILSGEDFLQIRSDAIVTKEGNFEG